MRKRSHMRQFNKTMRELRGIQIQQGSVPLPVVEWAERYFAALPEIQSVLTGRIGDEDAAVEAVKRQMAVKGIIPRKMRDVSG